MSLPAAVVVDFDGTITMDDTLELVVQRFGSPQVQSADQAALGAALDTERATRILMAHRPWKGRRGGDGHGGRDHLRRGFPEFVTVADASGIRLVVVSSGVRELIGPVLVAHGIADVGRVRATRRSTQVRSSAARRETGGARRSLRDVRRFWPSRCGTGDGDAGCGGCSRQLVDAVAM